MVQNWPQERKIKKKKKEFYNNIRVFSRQRRFRREAIGSGESTRGSFRSPRGLSRC